MTHPFDPRARLQRSRSTLDDVRTTSYHRTNSGSMLSSGGVTSALEYRSQLRSWCDDVDRATIRTWTNVRSAEMQRKLNSFRPTGTSKFYSSQYPSR